MLPNPLVAKVKGASVSLPVIDAEATRAKMVDLMSHLLGEVGHETMMSHLREAVRRSKALYTRSHDGFRTAKGVKKSDSMTVGELVAFSVAATTCFDLLPAPPVQSELKIGIGVMAPAIQDCGKNLIRLLWRAAGFEVVDLGNTLRPDGWLNAISRHGLSLLGISCMASGCVEKLHQLLSALVARGWSQPVILGGIAVNKVLAFELAREYALPIYYGRDVSDAEAVLHKAISKAPADVPRVQEVERIDPPAEFLCTVGRHSVALYRIGISDIVIDAHARDGCASCAGDKQKLCPLATGYEKQRPIEESKALIRGYRHAVLVVAADVPDESDRQTCKALWEALLNLEQHFAITYNDADAFRFPMTCPFCLPRECKLPKGQCVMPTFYRPLHETFSINIPKTLENVFGDAKPTGIVSLILVR